MMKSEFHSLVIFCFVIILTLSSCKNEDKCPNPNAKVSLTRKDSFIPYQGNENLNFLHNNTDTQIFIGQGKETYYITESASGEGECPKDYESVVVKFKNLTTNDLLSLAYERDRSVFNYNQSSNPYTFYKLSYKNKIYFNQLSYTNSDSIAINGKYYNTVITIGNDTSSNFAKLRLITGVLRIRIQDENWDLIP